jgi:fumarate hydratase class II
MPTDQQLWGGETAKAVENFPISGEAVPVSVIHWLARIKGAAAAVNGELGLLSKRSASRIEKPPRSPPASTTASFRSTSSRPARARPPT